VSELVDKAVSPLLENPPEHQEGAAQLHAQLRSCLSSHNICGVVDNPGHGAAALVAGDVTADLPQFDSAKSGSPVVFLVRSIPHIRNDANQYCLVSEKLDGGTSEQQWNVYGWVIAPNAGETLPLQRQVLEDNSASDPKSLRGLAAALWFFAERMSGRSAP
jgi:hypothetical protein